MCACCVWQAQQFIGCSENLVSEGQSAKKMNLNDYISINFEFWTFTTFFPPRTLYPTSQKQACAAVAVINLCYLE